MPKKETRLFRSRSATSQVQERGVQLRRALWAGLETHPKEGDAQNSKRIGRAFSKFARNSVRDLLGGAVALALLIPSTGQANESALPLASPYSLSREAAAASAPSSSAPAPAPATPTLSWETGAG